MEAANFTTQLARTMTATADLNAAIADAQLTNRKNNPYRTAKALDLAERQARRLAIALADLHRLDNPHPAETAEPAETLRTARRHLHEALQALQFDRQHFAEDHLLRARDRLERLAGHLAALEPPFEPNCPSAATERSRNTAAANFARSTAEQLAAKLADLQHVKTPAEHQLYRIAWHAKEHFRRLAATLQSGEPK